MTKQTIRDLSIQVNLNGLSFCVLNRTLNTFTFLNTIDFKSKLTPVELLIRLKELLSTNPAFSEDLDSVQVIHYNELSTLVPEKLYEEANDADYLKFNTKILRTDFIANDKLESGNEINVYVPYVNINNYLFDTFGAFTYKHVSTLFIDAIRRLNITSNETQLHIDINSSNMMLLVMQNDTILLQNHFEFSSPEDFIYYILFTVEQLQLDTETLQLYLSGTIEKGDDLFAIAYKYIRHINFNTFDTITSVDQIKSHTHFILKNSF